MRPERVGIERELAWLEAGVCERRSHDLLPGALLAEQRRRLHEVDQQLLDRGLLGRDGGQQLVSRSQRQPVLNASASWIGGSS